MQTVIAHLDWQQVRARPSRAMARAISHLLLQGRPVTTGHRWLNPLLLAQFAMVKRLPQIKPVRKPIYIVGTGRSGTTILGRILSLHPQIAFLNEPKALWYSINVGDDLIGSYSEEAGHYKLQAHHATTETQRAAHRLYGYALAITASERILDKYPEMIFRVGYLRAIFPDAKFIFLVRNGWDTSSSVGKWSRRHLNTFSGERHDWWGIDNRKWKLLVSGVVSNDPVLGPYLDIVGTLEDQQQMAMIEWVATMREGLCLMERYPGRFHKVHFESLVSRPAATLEKLLDYCELAKDDVVLNYATSSLKTPPAKTPFALPAALRDVVDQTMSELGY